MFIWLQEEAIHQVHKRQIVLFGGLYGVREPQLLKSAIARPQQFFHYTKIADVFSVAAYYAIGITKNHPFFDGNKRTAFAACGMFLLRNEYDITASQEEVYQTMVDLSAGGLSDEAFIEWVQKHAHLIR